MEDYIEFFSELHPFQVDGLVIFLMMFQNNGACMQTSLAVQTGAIFQSLNFDNRNVDFTIKTVKPLIVIAYYAAPLILLLHASYLFSTIGFPWQSYQGILHS